MILGFDLSSTVCGYCILDERGEVVELSYLSFKSDVMVEKSVELKELINKLFSSHNITEFFIEERLQGFRAGGTNADAMFKTAAMNFCGQVFIHEKGIPITALNVNNARSTAMPGFHKLARATKGTKHKEIAFKIVKEKLGAALFPTKVMKSGKRKGETIFLDEAQDMADAWVIAKAGFLKSK